MVAITAMGGQGPLLALAALLPLLALAPLAAVVEDGTTTPSPDCPDHGILFRLDSFRWQVDRNDSRSADHFLMQVTGNATCQHGFPPINVTLMDVTLVYTSTEQTLVNVIGYGNFSPLEIKLYFPINDSTIDYEEELYYVVSAIIDVQESHENEWERDAASVWQPIKLNGAAKFAMGVRPGVIEAHDLQPLNLTRLSHTQNVSLDNCEPAGNEYEACYFQKADKEEQDVCVTSDGGEPILICDDTVEFVPVTEKTNLVSFQLLYSDSDGVVTVNKTNQDTTLELYQYFPNETNETYEPCEESTSCNLTPFEPSNEIYTFRMVELDSKGTPTSSREVIVQDFNVTTRGISSDTAQVSWDSSNGGEFKVTITPGKDLPFSSRVVSCNEPLCDFFFIGLQEYWQNYTTSVRRVIGDDFTSEVVTSLKGPPGETQSDMNITRLNHYRDDNNGTNNTEACFEYNPYEPIGWRLLLIDSTGLSLQSSESYVMDGNTTYCFDPVEIPEEFNTRDQTRILVDFLANETAFSTQVDIFLFTPDIQQVSNASARATWRNLNSAEFFTSRAPGYDNHEEPQKLKCSYTGDQCYYYVNEDEAGSGNFSLLETSEKLNQSSTVQLKMKNIPMWIDIDTPFSILHDDHLQVCFDAVPKVDRYELGIELLGELVSSDQHALNKTVSGNTCAVSSRPVTLGAYEKIWAVVVAYDADGAMLSSGETNYEDTFLSPNRFVLAVTSGQKSPVTLRASWYILDDTTSFEIYSANLVNAIGATPPPATVVMPKTTSSFTIENEGLYSVCVSVPTPDGKLSEQTCSDIVTVNFTTDIPEPSPEVKNVQPFYTSDNTLKVSWDRPENASSLLVSWRDVTTRHPARNGRSLRSIETARNSAFIPRKREAQESSPRGSDVAVFASRKVDVPLPQARSLQNINDQISRVLLPDITGDGFTLVPASQSSVDIPLDAGNTWNICVSAVKNHHSGTEFCLKASIDGGDTVVSPPTSLTFKNNQLSWQTPAEGGPYSYYIEFVSGSESLSHSTDGTSLRPEDLVEAGEWHATVHSYALIDTKNRLSKGLTTVIVVNGIKVTYEQTGSRNVTLSWEETSNSLEDHEQAYIVSLVGMEPVNTTCSRATGCSVTFVNVQAEASQMLGVTVKSNNMMEELQIYFLDIKTVPANKMRSALNANGSATVTWDCLEDISSYNVSLVDKDDVVLINAQQTMPCSYTFSESDLTTLEADSVLLQACLESYDVLRCGDPQKVYLWPDVPKPTTDTSNVLVIVLSSVAAGLLLILMVAGIVYKLRSDKAKRTAVEDTSDDGGSVVSQNGKSGSQHSVEPPGDQPTTASQADAANRPSAQSSSQPAGQRQTPVQYRSAASVSQMQPSNGITELNIRASQYPDAVRAPISSVNPNVRYDGPAQRNVPRNPGPQRFPQVGNPPQRFSGLAANPNVRAAGPLRMSVPAGQPRMNNVPSGQPRYQPQGARMNQPPTSQPIEVLGRFSGALNTRPTPMSTRAPAPRPTGLQMLAPPARYPPPGQRSAHGPPSPTRLQAPPSGLKPIPRVGGGGYVDMNPSPLGLRQISSDRFARQPQPQNPRGQARNNSDSNRPNYNERVF